MTTGQINIALAKSIDGTRQDNGILPDDTPCETTVLSSEEWVKELVESGSIANVRLSYFRKHCTRGNYSEGELDECIAAIRADERAKVEVEMQGKIDDELFRLREANYTIRRDAPEHAATIKALEAANETIARMRPFVDDAATTPNSEQLKANPQWIDINLGYYSDADILAAREILAELDGGWLGVQMPVQI